MNPPIWALPGFLGLKSDWNVFDFQNLQAFDPCEFRWNSLSEWGRKFNQLHARHSVVRPVLMGYSLGGRLALHALIEDPSLWLSAIIISAHPGLEVEEDLLERTQSDEKWAFRFEKENRESVLNDWNNQSVFKNAGFHFDRKEKDYIFSDLLHVLQAGSLGLQANLRQKIHQLNLPILWINGEKDEKFCKAAQSIQLRHPLSKKVIVPQAGHRAPWEQPEIFRQLIQNFILI